MHEKRKIICQARTQEATCAEGTQLLIMAKVTFFMSAIFLPSLSSFGFGFPDSSSTYTGLLSALNTSLPSSPTFCSKTTMPLSTAFASTTFFASPMQKVTQKPITATNTRPIVRRSWNMPVPLPRESASRHSARYIGTITPKRPAAAPCIARPPTIIQKLPPSKNPDAQITGIDTRKRSAEATIIFLRPNHSARRPATSDDGSDPQSAMPTIHPIWSSLNVEVLSMYGNAAAMTPTSTP